MVVRISGVEREVAILDETLLLDRMGMSAGNDTAELELCAPMPGKVLNVLVKPGDTVNPRFAVSFRGYENGKRDQPVSATVEEVPANAGSAVEKGELL